MKELENSVEEVKTPQGEAQSPPVGAGEQPEKVEEQTSPQGEEHIKSSEQKTEPEAKPKTRLEKRIEKLEQKAEEAKTPKDKEKITSLLDKLKMKLEKEKAQSFTPPPPIFDGTETEIDPIELQQRVQQTTSAIVQKTLAEERAKEKFKKTVEEHLEDWKKVKEEHKELFSNPKLADFINNEYMALNRMYNPFTGKYELMPAVKPSEVIQRLKPVLDNVKIEAQAEVSGRLIKDINTSSPPTSSQSSSTTSEEALIKRAQETGADEDWAKVIKARFFKK